MKGSDWRFGCNDTYMYVRLIVFFLRRKIHFLTPYLRKQVIQPQAQSRSTMAAQSELNYHQNLILPTAHLKPPLQALVPQAAGYS